MSEPPSVTNLVGGAAAAVEAALDARPTHLRLERCKLGARTLDRLAAARTLESLELISCGLSATSAARLFDAADWPRLVTLDLRGNKVAGALAQLAARPLPALRDLRLAFTGLRAAHISSLHALGTIERWTSGADAFGAPEIRAIVSDSGWPLVAIKSYRQPWGVGGFEILARDAPSSLRALVLYEVKAGARAFTALASSALTLDELRCRYDKIGSPAFATLVESPPARTLTKLQISQCPLDDAAITALVHTELPEGLEDLDLSSSPSIGARGLAAFGERSWPRLRRLVLGGCSVHAHGARALASARLPALEVLELWNAGLDDDAVAALAAAPWLASVRVLSISGGAVSQRGIDALARSPYAERLEELAVIGTPFERDGGTIPKDTPLAHARLRTSASP
ncbi:MAG: hypothetical protein U0353_09420 [Sandaracinus sp.]